LYYVNIPAYVAINLAVGNDILFLNLGGLIGLLFLLLWIEKFW